MLFDQEKEKAADAKKSKTDKTATGKEKKSCCSGKKHCSADEKKA